MGTDSTGEFAEWDEERYSTNIERFDEQHKRLFGLLNDLHTAMNEGHSEEEVGDILRELERYTEYHFGDEEEFMQNCGYAMDCSDCFYNHREMHEEFAGKVQELREKHENGEYVTMEVLTVARDWLDAHIAAGDEDQNYADYFQSEVSDDYEYEPGQLYQDRTASEDPVPVDRQPEDAGVRLDSDVYDGGSLSVPEGSVAAWFEDIVSDHGDRTAALVRDDGEFVERSFEEMAERAKAVAGGLLSTELRPGDRLAIRAQSQYEWSVLDLACHFAGLVPVALYPSASNDRAAQIIERTGATGLVAAGDEAGDLSMAVETVLDFEALPTAEARVLPGLQTDGDEVATVAFDVAAPAEKAGCALTHRNLLAAAESLREGLPTGPGATGTCSLPLAHIYQRVATYYLWATGSAVAYLEAEEFVEQLAAVKPDVLVGVPKMYQQLYGTIQDRLGDMGWMKRKVGGRVASYGQGIVEGRGTPLKYRAAKRLVYKPLRRETGLSNLTYALSGTGRLDDHLLYFFRGLGVPICELYGSVGTTGVGALNPAASFVEESIGDPMPGVEIAVSESREILVRGPTVLGGFLDGDQTGAQTLRDDWYHTGEVGEVGPDGELSLAE
ncbi:long-chain fatty acid--CoA ligase (plasmid) [Haloarcula hispanica N601]|uniref:Long-chain fatty acid--CoA ligase n=2 Tax=Haloarcula hispanica TaxID=51589 RepID=V5TUL9_HALHI|nr:MULTISPECIES: bacteriohemerythrin [Haloarcula]AEM59423.1 putative long-chain-fatty-acid-CoA ligase [Haloarcula hispanica ATCC 33960]AHB68269.1 long-chain fatty acid--CoA ligase [Haloarcula hispanica N601]KZX46475.1 long-chain fatty acid--CoA ligase [Haloarcula sp. K1]